MCLVVMTLLLLLFFRAPTSKLLVADHAALDAPKPVGGSGFPSGT